MRAITRIEILPPDFRAANENRLCASVAFLSEHHFPRPLLSRASRHALTNGTTAASELLAHGMISEDAYYRTLAEHHGIDFLGPHEIEGALTASSPIPLSKQGAWCRTGGGVQALFAPGPESRFLRQNAVGAGIGENVPIRLTTPSALRGALIHRNRSHLGEEASERLATNSPAHSAKFGAGAWHGFVLGTFLAALAAGLVISPGASLLTAHAFLSVFFLSCVLLRLAALTSFPRAGLRTLGRYPNTERPVYSVIVALHREAPVVPDLVRSLKAIRWPRSKLEIKLVCEEGDTETLQALSRQKLDRCFEIIEVPATGPQTKPKALNFALPFCSGDLITLYDAEDRPHPDQIEEAWQAFRAEDGRLGALQAPLIIANPRRNLLTALFHLEFAALFGGILPWLAKRDMPIPLGGTSTHFRRDAIEQAGAWDSYNVTEDADLGFRMWRSGYRIGLLTRPTYEDAPDSLGVWLRQRTRWIKGWMQTWVVRTRRVQPRCSGRRLAGAMVMHVVLAGTVISSLFYPFTIATVAALAALAAFDIALSPAYVWLAWLDWTNIGASFAIYAALCLRAVDRKMRFVALRTLPALPLYWLIGAVAGWRAVRQYFTKPFLWEKTPHKAHDPRGEFHHP